MEEMVGPFLPFFVYYAYLRPQNKYKPANSEEK